MTGEKETGVLAERVAERRVEGGGASSKTRSRVASAYERLASAETGTPHTTDYCNSHKTDHVGSISGGSRFWGIFGLLRYLFGVAVAMNSWRLGDA